jgi:S1-C subfamily serine protease
VLNIPRGSGSGFVYAAPGGRPVIVTNAHVVAGAAEVRVTLIDQAVYRARLLGLDRQKDVAVLELVDAPPEVLADLRPIPLGASSGLFVGQRVLAIGNPFGLDHTLTAGIVSGLNRELATGENGQMIKGASESSCFLELPVEAENSEPTNQPLTDNSRNGNRSPDRCSHQSGQFRRPAPRLARAPRRD